MQELLTFAHAHIGLMAALFTLLLAIIVHEVHGSITGGKQLSTPEAVRLINDSNALILDIRSVSDFKKGHLLNAVNIPKEKLLERTSELPKDKSRPIIVVCVTGATARETALLLQKQGHTSAFALAGGIMAWNGASLPVTVK